MKKEELLAKVANAEPVPEGDDDGMVTIAENTAQPEAEEVADDELVIVDDEEGVEEPAEEEQPPVKASRVAPAGYEDLPEKYWGKSPSEIARMHQEAEREMTRTNQERADAQRKIAEIEAQEQERKATDTRAERDAKIYAIAKIEYSRKVKEGYPEYSAEDTSTWDNAVSTARENYEMFVEPIESQVNSLKGIVREVVAPQVYHRTVERIMPSLDVPDADANELAGMLAGAVQDVDALRAMKDKDVAELLSIIGWANYGQKIANNGGKAPSPAKKPTTKYVVKNPTPQVLTGDTATRDTRTITRSSLNAKIAELRGTYEGRGFRMSDEGWSDWAKRELKGD